jgi:hypothetical protein
MRFVLYVIEVVFLYRWNGNAVTPVVKPVSMIAQHFPCLRHAARAEAAWFPSGEDSR